MTTRRDRYRGALLGLAVGDAVGTTAEFNAPGSFPPVTDMTGGGPFGLPPGAWTDDTSMALCLADSLLARRAFDPVDQLERYVGWYRRGERSATGRCFDIGNATRAALERFERTGEPYPGDVARDAAGNGPLMKLAPVVMAFGRDRELAREAAVLSARTTHGAAQARDAARWFAALLVRALDGDVPPELWATGRYGPAHEEVAAIVAGSFLVREPPLVRGTGYVVHALEAALWAVRSTSSFSDCILAAANLGDDADTTAAIAGQLAGATYGAAAIPEAWRRRLHLGDEIEALADALLELSESPQLLRELP